MDDLFKIGYYDVYDIFINKISGMNIYFNSSLADHVYWKAWPRLGNWTPGVPGIPRIGTCWSPGLCLANPARHGCPLRQRAVLYRAGSLSGLCFVIGPHPRSPRLLHYSCQCAFYASVMISQGSQGEAAARRGGSPPDGLYGPYIRELLNH